MLGTTLRVEDEMQQLEEVRASLSGMGLIAGGERISLMPLTGGVSSRILLVEARGRRFCFKQALPKLNVAAEWYAPVERNRAEAGWIRTANAMLPGIAPTLLAEDREVDAFAMEFLAPCDHPVWKAQLLSGDANTATAVAAGHVLAVLHSRSAACSNLADEFSNAADFHALRIEPYLLATGLAHPDIAEELHGIAAATESTRTALIHGDYSPKNLLVGGPAGIIVLDAECATWGDPAFDLAFCLTHLLLKARFVSRPAASTAAVYAMLKAYRPGIDWEAAERYEQRLARLLPALMLARVDGKSPVEYLDESQRHAVRAFAKAALRLPFLEVDALIYSWLSEGVE